MVIGFFAPFPLAMMMPFMAAQSMMMGDAFGKSYQYGKRKISAMSNEEFNRMNATTLGREILTDYSAIIPSMKSAIAQSSDFQSFVVTELTKVVANLPADLIQGATQNAPNPITTIAGQATGDSQIDYGKLAIAILQILNPVGSLFTMPEAFGSPGKSGSDYPTSNTDQNPTENIPIDDKLKEEKTQPEPEYVLSYSFMAHHWDPQKDIETKRRTHVIDKYGSKKSRLLKLKQMETLNERAVILIQKFKLKHDRGHRSGSHYRNYHKAMATQKTAFNKQQAFRRELRRNGII